MNSLYTRITNILHIFEAFAADIIYNFPSKKLKVIGVTGTDGKTTTTHLIYHILIKSGRKASMISSVVSQIGSKKYKTGLHTTTPRPFLVRKFMRQAVETGSEFFVLETTSHALTQNRVWGIDFFIGVLTNITSEHLYFHKTFKSYFEAKMKLLKVSQNRFVNLEMKEFPAVAGYMKRKSMDFMIFSVNKTDKSDYCPSEKILSVYSQTFMRENLAAAFAVSKFLQVPDNNIYRSIRNFVMPIGRFDIVHDRDFKVIIDFAHTPNSLDELLGYIHGKYKAKKNKIIHVFGAASQRDDSKRPLMGRVSSKYADVILLTEEDFRHENLKEINKQIIKGISKKFKFADISEKIGDRYKIYSQIANRQDAINQAVSFARNGDIVVLTGKGHERSLNRDGVEYPWDEYKAVRIAIKKFKK